MADKLTIRTNNVPRDVLYGHDLTERERAEFDWMDWSEPEGDGWASSFIRYKGVVYHLNDFERISREPHPQRPGLEKWHGMQGDSFFSGVVVRIIGDGERVVMGTYFA